LRILEQTTIETVGPNAQQKFADNQVYPMEVVERDVHTVDSETAKTWRDNELPRTKKQHSKLGYKCSFGWH
jgi:hypothetical protein